MKNSLFVAAVMLTLVACEKDKKAEEVISQKFVHKYGFEVSEKEWEERAKEGKIISKLEKGVEISSSYVNGILHGEVKYTFPNSSIIEKIETYNEGVLTKMVINDARGIPMREEAFSFDNRVLLTLWNESGIPISIEEYEKDLLLLGTYYNPSHEIEAQVKEGVGVRVKRERSGTLVAKDKIEKGKLVARTLYNRDGTIQSQSSYLNYKLNGEQIKFDKAGDPAIKFVWDNGILNGLKITYKHGAKFAEIPYVKGKREGIERHFNKKGDLTAEIKWTNDQKQGPAHFYYNDNNKTNWYFKNKKVSYERFKALECQEKLMAKLERPQ